MTLPTAVQQQGAELVQESAAQHKTVMRRSALLIFAGTFLIYLAFLPPGIYSVDGYSMVATAESLATRHSFEVPDGVVGREGRTYSPWYPLNSILAVPMVGASIKAAKVFHLPPHYAESFAVTVLPAFYTALTVALVYVLAMVLGSAGSGAWLAAIAYGFGTIGLAYTRDFYADPLLALLVVGSMLLVFGEKLSWCVVPLTALALLAKPTGIIVGPVLSAYLLFKTRRFWLSTLPGLGTAIGLGTYFLFNLYRFGNFRKFGHAELFSLRYVPEGFVGLLISPGFGLVWYCPCVILVVVALWQIKSRRLEAWTAVALLAASLLLHSLWLGWFGGASWGPRLLLPVLPGLVALTSLVGDRWRKALVATVVIGFLINAPNLLSSGEKRYFAEAGEQGITGNELSWSPARSPLLNAWPAAIRQVQDARKTDVRQILAERTPSPATTIATSRALRVVGLWWWVLPVVHVSRIWGVVVSTVLTALGVWLLLAARQVKGKFAAEEEYDAAS
jgi:hypothetical protein